MNSNYKTTIYACFVGYIVQAIVNNFAPLLFVTFESSYNVPLSKITILITVNFLIQLFIDMLSARFIDRIGYRASVIIAHIFSAVGLLLLTFLPELLPDPYIGILISVCIYAIGGGLIEVLISPMVEACPTENKEKTMSLLHSFYCFGHVLVVLLSTGFFALFGIGNWMGSGTPSTSSVTAARSSIRSDRSPPQRKAPLLIEGGRLPKAIRGRRKLPQSCFA